MARRAVVAAALSGLGAGFALASPGCDAVNSGALNYHIETSTPATSKSVNGAFLNGDKLTLSVAGILNLTVADSLKLTLGAATATAPGTDVSDTSLNLTADGTESTAGWQVGAGVTDGPVDLTVVCAAALTTSSTAIKSSLNPSLLGQAVTFTATVTSPAGTPTGTVTFFDGATALGDATLSSGVATLTTSALTLGTHPITAQYAGGGGFPGSVSPVLNQVVNNSTGTTTAIASSLNPSLFGQAVTFTATVTAPSGTPPVNAPAATPTGTVTFFDGTTALGTATLSGGVATLTTSALVLGTHPITAQYAGGGGFSGSVSPVLSQLVNGATATVVSSSLNPSQLGQAVTFTAKVTSPSGTPTGTVTFLDGATALGTASLAGGIATIATSTLTVGTHPISAVYGGSNGFPASTSQVLAQVVNVNDSSKLRDLQLFATKVVALTSGAAISTAVGSAVTEGFEDSCEALSPTGNGIRFNLAGFSDPTCDKRPPGPRRSNAFAAEPSQANGFAAQPAKRSRIDDAFGALAYAGPTKAPPLVVAPREWLAWAEVRGAFLDRSGSVGGATLLYGDQTNALVGVTRKLTPNFLVGVLGGYETFDYRSDVYGGRLKGDGWTVGSYLGWKLTPGIRFDAAVAYSGIGYDGSAGLAAGNFSGTRWMIQSGLTGTYQSYGLQIEPSARVYALWERETAFTDTLGTLQAERTFSTGRASAGVKVGYPVAWTPTVALLPYAGLYGDYYFNSDDGVVALGGSAVPLVTLMDGWSARAVGGISAKFANGAQVLLGGERGGIGGGFGVWTYRARASVPF